MKKIFIVILLWLPSLLWAWNETGHQLIAAIAYERLRPEARREVDELMRHFSKENRKLKTLEQSASWPDTLRAQKIELYSRWHFIDLPYMSDATLNHSAIDTDNIVWALTDMLPVLQNHRVKWIERARTLVFFTHCVGDVHQPMHAITRISARYPQGDRGGNLYATHYSTGDRSTTNLHALWDSGLGNFDFRAKHSTLLTLAHMITARYPENYFIGRVTDLNPEHWARESFQIAKTFAYTTPENQSPSVAYLNEGTALAEQQIALAGYRLAEVLNIFFKKS